MYFAVGHISVKKDQDRSLCIAQEQYRLLALCDGIGEFRDSGRVAELLVEAINEEKPEDRTELEGSIRTALEGVKVESLEGGSTLLCCYQCGRHAPDEVTINHLGNGTVVHLSGDFHTQGASQLPYRFHHVVLPHVDDQGVLIRHVSHNSGIQELALGEITLRLNAPCGDILLLLTDGIATLEEEMIVKDPSGNPWRYHSKVLGAVLEKLHAFLSTDGLHQGNPLVLADFVNRTLAELKAQGALEDDASIGLVITEAAMNHYRKQRS